MTVKLPNRNCRIIALRSFKNREVVAHGNKVEAVVERARKAGVADPVVVYVPRFGQNTIY
jgi:hypothetical protein